MWGEGEGPILNQLEQHYAGHSDSPYSPVAALSDRLLEMISIR